ncbi:MAG: bifunctional glutamate--cysteine ligase GshA/glutathione synthetase GshB [Bacillota bacterium]|nr:bifunctional glutamate--cysteine ligase GshA/glutathione synthetase GshB [Bacillota bacterium]
MLTDYESMELSTQILMREALERGIKVDILDETDNFIRLVKGNKVEYIKQATKTSADSYIAPLIMENKEVTKLLLCEAGINVPQGVLVHSIAEGLGSYAKFQNKDIVIKPKSTNFGEGVFILKKTEPLEAYKRALEAAFELESSIIIEEFFEGKEYRFLVIGGEVPAVLHRVPANVTGNGADNIMKLVQEKNRNPLRGSGYSKPLEKIRLGDVEKSYLQLQDRTFEYVPAEGEIVYLRENSNISTGGDSIDYTDDVLEDYKEIALKAAKAVGAQICGADIIIKDIKENPDFQNYSIIELNFNPALHIHRYPYIGKERYVEKKVLDLLGF